MKFSYRTFPSERVKFPRGTWRENTTAARHLRWNRPSRQVSLKPLELGSTRTPIARNGVRKELLNRTETPRVSPWVSRRWSQPKLKGFPHRSWRTGFAMIFGG